MRQIFFHCLVILSLSLLLGSCGTNGDECGRGLEGDSCLAARDCECDLRCVENICSRNETVSDGDEEYEHSEYETEGITDYEHPNAIDIKF